MNRNTISSGYLWYKWFKFSLLNRQKYIELQNKRLIDTSDGYSFKPFDDSQSIFIHIPKCAGVSVNKSLYGNLAGGHASYSDYTKIFSPKELSKYFKFTFVRNPWDRVVSAYFFLQKGGFNAKDKAWFDKELSQFPTFEEFVTQWLSKENIQKGLHFKPQYHYICDSKGAIQVDYIGYMETINDDFDKIKGYLGLNVTLPKNNKGEHSSYIKYYTPETQKIVADVYDIDIKMFGYTFDGIKEKICNQAINN